MNLSTELGRRRPGAGGCLRAQLFCESDSGESAAVGMRRARSVTGPLRRAHPASGATWNVQVR